MGPYGIENFKNATPPTNRSRKFLNFSCFFPNGPHKTTFRIFEILKIFWNLNEFIALLDFS